jgi:hypothetical protein
MRFRVWHLLAAMAFVALWAPLSQSLLALEALDHPQRPQTALEKGAFWIGSAPIAGAPLAIAWIVTATRRERRRREGSFTNYM